MNKNQRSELENAAKMLEDAKEIIEKISEEEQNKYDNLSEGLQQSKNGKKISENVYQLFDICDSVQQAADEIQEVISN